MLTKILFRLMGDLVIFQFRSGGKRFLTSVTLDLLHVHCSNMVIQQSFAKEHFLADIARFTKGRVSSFQMDPHINLIGTHFFKTDSTCYVFATRVLFHWMGGSPYLADSLMVGHLNFGHEVIDATVATWIFENPIMPLV